MTRRRVVVHLRPFSSSSSSNSTGERCGAPDQCDNHGVEGTTDRDRAGAPDPAETTDEQVLAWLEEYRDLSLEVIEDHAGDPEGAVRGLVALHVEWTEVDPDRARAVAAGRGRVAAGDLGGRLRDSNRILFRRLAEWVGQALTDGAIRTDSVALLHALVFAPTQELARLHLAGLLDRPLGEYREALARAAWDSIRADSGND